MCILNKYKRNILSYKMIIFKSLFNNFLCCNILFFYISIITLIHSAWNLHAKKERFHKKSSKKNYKKNKYYFSWQSKNTGIICLKSKIYGAWKEILKYHFIWVFLFLLLKNSIIDCCTRTARLKIKHSTSPWVEMNEFLIYSILARLRGNSYSPFYRSRYWDICCYNKTIYN